MIFYKFTASLSEEEWASGNNDRKIYFERKRQIGIKTTSLNKKDPDKFWFIHTLSDIDVSGAVLSKEAAVDQTAAANFLSTVGIEVGEIILEETTFGVMRSLISDACDEDFIAENDSKVLDSFGLAPLLGYKAVDFGEILLNDRVEKTELMQTARENASCETLIPELERIYMGRAQAGYGHPVHYMIESDDVGIVECFAETVLTALFKNGRLGSRRFCYVDFVDDKPFSALSLDALYKSCYGGAVVIRKMRLDDSGSDDIASSDFDLANLIGRMATKHKNKVLTVICLPRECTGMKKIFLDGLDNISVIEIREDLADCEQSREYLKTIAKKNGVRTDKKLFAALDSDKKYIPSELVAIYDRWYGEKLKTSIYPQYSDVTTQRAAAVKAKPAGTAYDELFSMTGLTEAKAVITKALNYYKVRKLFKEYGAEQDTPSMHMIFTGNPGTAKTTVARLFSRIMKENGLLSRGHIVEVGRKDLVGRYVGWTAGIVRSKFKEAMGGVLFIDEAYSLVDDRDGSFGDEAINAIVQEMENRREGLIVIFAGYPDKMKKFLDKNPGLRSRIAFHVPFADYSVDELCKIAEFIGGKKGISFTDGAMSKMRRAFEAASASADFGNGRYVRNLIELSGMNLASRVLGMDSEKVTKKILTTVEEEDIEIPARSGNSAPVSIGFVS